MDVEETLRRRNRILSLDRRYNELLGTLQGFVLTALAIASVLFGFHFLWGFLIVLFWGWLVLCAVVFMRAIYELLDRRAKLNRVKDLYTRWERTERTEGELGLFTPLARFPWEDEPLGDEVWN